MITIRLRSITTIVAISTLSAFAQPPPSSIGAASALEVDAFLLGATDATAAARLESMACSPAAQSWLSSRQRQDLQSG